MIQTKRTTIHQTLVIQRKKKPTMISRQKEIKEVHSLDYSEEEDMVMATVTIHLVEAMVTVAMVVDMGVVDMEAMDSEDADYSALL